jgi:hypothetical protein
MLPRIALEGRRNQFNPSIAACLFDHFIRSRQHVRWNRQADLLCRLEVDYKLELGWLLDGEIGGLSAFQNLIDVNGGAAI